MAIACSRCGSTDVTKASLVYEMNTFAGTGTTKGVGIGTGGIGVGVGRTQTTSHSQLAQRVAPPDDNLKFHCELFFYGVMIIGVVCLFKELTWFAWFFWSALWSVVVYMVVRHDNRKRADLLEEYNRKWLCNTCGTLLIVSSR